MTVLEQHLDEYLKLRRTLGHKLAHAHRYLPRFVSYLDERGAEFVTIQAALAWSLERAVPVGSVVPADRMMVVRGFARYLSGIDPRTEVPPAGAIRHPQRWRRPFIYSENDVLAMIDQADRRIAQPLRSATYQTLIGLLATTGLRVGEALRLDRSDLDRSEGVLRIRVSKFGKSRLVPLHASALDALERYDHTRQHLCPDPSTDSLFVSLRGTRVIYECVWPTHRKLCELAGVGADSTVRPRIHDHRHSFAVKTLLGWYQEGVDVPSRISWLSTYLGHREPRYTYHYLSAAPDLLAHAARLLSDAQAVRMTPVAPTLQAFFTDRLTRQLHYLSRRHIHHPLTRGGPTNGVRSSAIGVKRRSHIEGACRSELTHRLRRCPRLLRSAPEVNGERAEAEAGADPELAVGTDELQQSAGSSRSLPLRRKSDHARVRRLTAAPGANRQSQHTGFGARDCRYGTGAEARRTSGSRGPLTAGIVPEEQRWVARAVRSRLLQVAQCSTRTPRGESAAPA